MKRDEFAKLLDGKEYRSELTKEEEQLAKDSGLLVCFGASNDLLKFRGIIENEIGVWMTENAFLFINRDNEIDVLNDGKHEELRCIFDYCKLAFNIITCKIRAIWNPEKLVCSWLIQADIPYSSFNIMEDGKIYCVGIVMDKVDIEAKLLKAR